MALSDVLKIASSETIFAVLFISFLGIFIHQVRQDRDSQKKENQERETYIFDLHKKREEELIHMLADQKEMSLKRETELMQHMGQITGQQAEISSTLKDVRDYLSKLEEKVEKNFTEVWKQLSGK